MQTVAVADAVWATTQYAYMITIGVVCRDGSNSLTLQELLAVLPALPATAAAARLILRQTTPDELRSELTDPAAQALAHQRLQVLRRVFEQGFQEADTLCTGVLKPGEQFKQLLFSVAAALTAVLIGAEPITQPVHQTLQPQPAVSPSPVNATYFLSDSGSAGYTSALGSLSGGAAEEKADIATPSGTRTADKMFSPEGRSSGSSSSEQRSQQGSYPEDVPGAQAAVPLLPADVEPTAAPSMQQQQQAQQPPSSSAPPGPPQAADVLVVDHTGDVLHYSCTVEEAAAAAVLGRPPLSRPGAEVHLYPQTMTSGRMQQDTPSAWIYRVSPTMQHQSALKHATSHLTAS